MMSILVYLYGLAAFLCFLGYLYALIEWYFRGNQLEWCGRLPNGHYEQIKQPSPAQSNTTRLTTPEIQHKFHVDKQLAEVNTNGSANIEEIVTPQEEPIEKIQETMNINQSTEESQTSWELRRAERRQRYKEEKCRLLQEVSCAADVQTNSDEEVNEFLTENDRNPWDINLVEERKINDETPSRKYSIPEEILAAHMLCSRRTSVQVTDLDDQLQTASIHFKEFQYVYGLGESPSIPIVQP